MPNPDRLTGLDASFLSLEKAGAHMHVGSVLLLDGPAPSYQELVAGIDARLHVVPRYRQKLAFPPLRSLPPARPIWVDDPHFNAGYHIRHTALPAPAGREELERLAGRVFSQALDRSKPLWEIWLVESVGDDQFALVCKTHHALVDGISGVDIMAVVFDLDPDAAEHREPAPAWYPSPEPSQAALLADAVAGYAGGPGQVLRAAAGVLAAPRAALRTVSAVAGMAYSGVTGAPSSPLNTRIGPHRRFTWVEADLARFKAIKGALGGTVNDVVLSVVTGALRALMLRRGRDPGGMTLKAMVPVSIRTADERGKLGNRVSAVYAPLPLGIADPIERFQSIHAAMGDLKASSQAVGAEALTQLAGFAAPTILDQAARLQGMQRLYNLTITNVPGPQAPLYLLGRRLRAFHPMVPLTLNTALGVAIMSYDGKLDFGLVGDYDAMPDLHDLAADLGAAIDELSVAAGVPVDGHRRSGRARPAARRRAKVTPA
jgi:WS/DGAT/MGAT family acyltransferase